MNALARTAGRNALLSLAILVCPALATAFEVAVTAPDDLRKDLERASLAVALSKDNKADHTSGEIIAAARSDYATMVSLLYNAGYFGPDVQIKVDGREAADIPPLKAPAAISRVDIIVRPGNPFVFGQAAIGPLAAGSEVPEAFATGEPARTSAIRSAARRALIDWRDAGHAKADIGGQSIVADHPRRKLDVDIRIAPGPELTFGNLTVTGNEDVRSEAIRRIAGYPQGARFSPEEVKTVTRRLRRTGAFSSARLIEAETPNPDDSLDMELQVGEALKRRFSIGAELTSDNGLELSGEWIHRNLFGGAERLSIEALIGTSDASGEFDGRIRTRLDLPAYFGTDTDLYFFGGLEFLDEPNYNTLNLFGGAGIRRVFSKDLTGEIGVGPFFSEADDAFGSNRIFRHVRFPALLQWDRRDDPVNATKGYYLGADAQPFFGIGNTESGVSAMFDGRGYLSVGRDIGLVLAGRALLGTVVGSSLSGTAPDLLFYSGGVNTVRGQPYQSLGVPVGTGFVGGRSFLGLSAELRKSVTDALSVVGFFDYGLVGPDAVLTGQTVSHSGAGLGVRYGLTGIGALRLDVALPVSGSTGNGVQFYIGIGQAF
ncbi:MAG: autotransporter assembly complex protein TamA [Marinibacterium sp.]